MEYRMSGNSSSPQLTYDLLRARRLQPAGTETFFLGSLQRRVSTGDHSLSLNINPDYQRGRVWTDEQASRFVGYLAEGGEAPPLFIQRWRYTGGRTMPPDELVDGLQRVTALLRFAANKIPMETPSGERAYLRDFSDDDQRIWYGPAGLKLTGQYVECKTRAEVLALYIRLNRGGTPHSEAEIERVRELLAQEQA